MTRSDAVRRLAALLRHAEADTHEGRNAARFARRLRRRWRITDADLVAARLADDDRLKVELPWDLPWLLAVAALAADACGVAYAFGPAGILLHGPGAGRAARRARATRAHVEARVEACGGDAGVCGLSSRPAPAQAAPTTLIEAVAAQYAWTPIGFGSPTLGMQYGSAALDVYRLTLAMRLLVPDVERRQKEAPRAEVREPQPARPEPARAGPQQRPSDAQAGGPTPPPDGPPQPVPAPPPTPGQVEATRRIRDLVARTQRLVSIAGPVAQAAPHWTREPVVAGALMVA